MSAKKSEKSAITRARVAEKYKTASYVRADPKSPRRILACPARPRPDEITLSDSITLKKINP